MTSELNKIASLRIIHLLGTLLHSLLLLMCHLLFLQGLVLLYLQLKWVNNNYLLLFRGLQGCLSLCQVIFHEN